MENTVAEVILYVLSAVGASAWLAAFLNKEYENKWLNALMKVINTIGANVFKAKNK